MLIYEKYRPKTFEEVVGQDRILKRIKLMQSRGGLGGKVFWLSGESGQGKTTLARLIALECADAYCVIEIDAQKLSISMLREFDRMCRFRPIGSKGHHAFIINEAHGLSTQVVSEFQTILEERHVQQNATWCFTTTNKGQKRLFDTKFDALPFLSRAIMLELGDWHGREVDFAIRCQAIAKKEQLDGQPLVAYIRLAEEERCNMRSMLNRIESGEFIV